MNAFPAKLSDLGLQVSTGPVVDFRLKEALRNHSEHSTVPLIYPETVRSGKVNWPPTKPRKPIAIQNNPETQKWLIRSGWYVVTKRFSAKEEKRRMEDTNLSQAELDRQIQEVLPIMSETKTALLASSRVDEALAILREISAPKEQQNERSALCLLALGDIRPETEWKDAERPLRGITEMMDWFRDEYGKNYAPNTRETVRRQTMHQFIQLGLVIENPDKQDRPINSPKWCYQLTDAALALIRSYDSYDWERAKQEYGIAAANILRERHRNLPSIPVTLPDGRKIKLSAGGQNESWASESHKAH